MLCYARLEIESKDAEKIAKALRVDDPEWCKCHSEEEKIVIEIKARKLSSLLYAIDDYLMHLKMCENI
ncbi:MAG: KEOPS complex subunit Pcc1 [Archaeoglobaceae archaeon]|nr:KEOPS complex subunit Pcc1 [Archaeoglobaceae archaeon]MDW8117715.1 KEOPS complex subunit Pcc1 [Archaeoglobaceae archaeon]